MDLQQAFDEGFEAVRAFVDASFSSFEKRIAAIEARSSGAYLTVDGAPPLVREEIAKAFSTAPKPQDGKSVTMDEVRPVLESLVEKAIAGIPRPIDGKSVTAEDVAPLVESEVERAVLRLPKAKDGADGVGVAGAMIDRDGNLLLTLSNGSVRELGIVVGKSVLESDVQPVVQRLVDAAVALLPKPSEGQSFTLSDIKALISDAVVKEVALLPKAIDGKDADPAVIEKIVSDAVAKLPPAAPGKDADPAEVKRAVEVAVSALPRPLDGKDADPALVEKLVAEAVGKLPVPRDGNDVSPEVVKALVVSEVAKIPRPEDGKSVDALEVIKMVDLAVDRAVKSLPPPPVVVAGEGMRPEDVSAIVERHVAKAVSALPPAQPGKDADAGLIAQDVLSRVTETLKSIPPPKNGEDGKSVTVEDVKPLLEDLVGKAVSNIPKPEDGKSITVEDVQPLLADLVSKAVAGIPAPKDGVGLASGVINRDGDLILTLSDGKSVSLGRVEGRDGASVETATVKSMIDDAVKSLPPPKDGADGLGFDDLDVVETEQGFMLQFIRGDRVKEIRLAIPRDCGTYKLGRVYNKGDGITDGGSFWFAKKDGVTERPGSCDDWRLGVKRGKDRSDPIKLSGKD